MTLSVVVFFEFGDGVPHIEFRAGQVFDGDGTGIGSLFEAFHHPVQHLETGRWGGLKFARGAGSEVAIDGPIQKICGFEGIVFLHQIWSF